MSRTDPTWVVVCTWETQNPAGTKHRYAHQRYFANQQAAWRYFHDHRDDPHPAATRMVLIDHRRGDQLAETGP